MLSGDQESCSFAAQHRTVHHVDRWINLRSMLTRIMRKFNSLRAALHGAAQQRIWIQRPEPAPFFFFFMVS
jgi:hypothetical protein